jgi:hypothetical protein
MALLISKLSKQEQKELLRDLNYLNLAEIKSFCKEHSIPYIIAFEMKDGTRRRTKDEDRKGVMLHRMRHFLQTGAISKETCFRSTVVCFDAVPRKLTPGDRLFYGQYDKSNRIVMALLEDLTGGEFEDGAIARILARTFWSRGEAPTFKEYAAAWLQVRKQHRRPNPEWAFLADRAGKKAGADWKKLRAKKANKLMQILAKITPIRSGAPSSAESAPLRRIPS